jgi:GntR family transcriptional regulator
MYWLTSTLGGVPAWLSIDPRHPLPIHAQLERGIRAAVATGRLAPGDQLPTVRQLAVDVRVNANTVARVYLDLERAGVVETRRGVGTFVASAQPALKAKRGREGELRTLVRGCLDEAATLGFSAEDVVRQIRQESGTEGG